LLGLLFEAWLFHPQLPELADLAAAFPQTTIVLVTAAASSV
jgi:L-fuconolactonase